MFSCRVFTLFFLVISVICTSERVLGVLEQPHLVFPQYADGQNLARTRLVLKNNGEMQDEGTVVFLDQVGQPRTITVDSVTADSFPYSLQAFGTVELLTSGEGALKWGALVVFSDNGVESRVEGTVIFEVLKTYASVPDSPVRSTHQTYVSVTPREDSGLAVYNPEPRELDMTMVLLNQQGDEVASRMRAIGPGEQFSDFVTTPSLFGEYFAGLDGAFKGTLNLYVEGGNVSALGLLQDFETGALFTTGTSPNTYLSKEGGPGGGGGPAPDLTPYILIDQFGYLPTSEKIAVIRDPVTGFDASESFSPGATYAVVSVPDGRSVYQGLLQPWKGGSEDASSGDRAWWFDFSEFSQQGAFYILDVQKNLRSFEFVISDGVYRQVLEQAVRTFFYQRAGFEKKAQYAGTGWADGASHVKPLQDKNCRAYNDKANPATEKDLHGGWYDAGDYNKYTNWTTSYVIGLLRAYTESPSVFTDNTNIPESGNGVPDLIDEVKWGMDWLLRMQNADGSVLSIVGLSHASPPSAAAGQSLYGSASTSATLSGAAAFAYGSRVFRQVGQTAYADLLLTSAEKAWDWAEAHPQIIFRNNETASGTAGLGAGQQETDDYGRLSKKLEAACYLFEVTGLEKYHTFFDGSYTEIHLIQWNFAYPFEAQQQDTLLYYAQLPNATPSVAEHIRSTFRAAMQGTENFPALRDEVDPYLANIKDYTWGSNSTKSNKGLMFMNVVQYQLDASLTADSRRAAQRYLHYIHGVNPLGMVYLSNMYQHGAEKSVNEFYHSWFTNGSALWDRVGVSTYGPPPGFLTGGPNPYYDWDGCCPSSCGSSQNNARCYSEPIEPPRGQPAQKSYKDFNTSWPLNSWSVTENSCGYQTAYIRLLSKFVH